MSCQVPCKRMVSMPPRCMAISTGAAADPDLGKFRDGELKLLIASDVAARPRHSECRHVFNFDVPIHSGDYVHRIGRTGRAGRSAGRSRSACRMSRNISTDRGLVKKAVPELPSPMVTPPSIPSLPLRRPRSVAVAAANYQDEPRAAAPAEAPAVVAAPRRRHRPARSPVVGAARR